jgi:hypothetical protein
LLVFLIERERERLRRSAAMRGVSTVFLGSKHEQLGSLHLRRRREREEKRGEERERERDRKDTTSRTRIPSTLTTERPRVYV